MKKVLFLIFASLLVLGACGNNDSEKKEDNKSSEHKKSNDSKKDKKSDDKKDNSKDNKNQNQNDDTTSIESQSTSKMIMANHKTIMVIMNVYKVSKLLSKTIINNKVVINNHKITMVI